MLRFLVFAVLAWGAYHLIKKIAKAYFGSLDSQEPPQPSGSDAELIRDPQCGAYFMKQQGVRGVIDGQVVHFCSQQCYDRYVESRSAK